MPRILVDNNLSLLLKEVLLTDFPESAHVFELGMAEASDTQIWQFAKTHFDAIITKDKDFYYRVILYGSPPKIIWITSENMRNRDLLNLIRREKDTIKTFLISKNDVLNIQ